MYLSLDAHCRTQQHPVSSPSCDDLNSERKAVRVASAGDRNCGQARVIDEWCQGGVSPRAYFLAIDRFGAQVCQRPGYAGNGRRQQKVELGKEVSERGFDGGTCAEGGRYLDPAQGKTTFDLAGHVGVEL